MATGSGTSLAGDFALGAVASAGRTSGSRGRKGASPDLCWPGCPAVGRRSVGQRQLVLSVTMLAIHWPLVVPLAAYAPAAAAI
jgi:hypothetical protein